MVAVHYLKLFVCCMSIQYLVEGQTNVWKQGRVSVRKHYRSNAKYKIS